MISSRARYVATCIGLVALAGLLALAGGALGGKKLKTESETVEVAGEENGSATATCKRGTKAVSGGYQTAGVDPDEFVFMVVDASQRDGGRKWTSSAFSASASSLTSFAYCRDEKVKSRSTSTTLAAGGETDTVTAKCPAGTKVVSGGFEADEIDLDAATTPRIINERSRKLGKREWEVRSFNNSGDASGELTAQVNCRDAKALKTKQESEVVSFSGPGVGQDVEQVVAKCKRKQRVVSGGYTAPPAGDPGGVNIRESRKVGKRQWQVTATAEVENSEPVTAYAYCEKKQKK